MGTANCWQAPQTAVSYQKRNATAAGYCLNQTGAHSHNKPPLSGTALRSLGNLPSKLSTARQVSSNPVSFGQQTAARVLLAGLHQAVLTTLNKRASIGFVIQAPTTLSRNLQIGLM